jgi:signal transduction histidine kinase/ActR/RegA family two-component response regulator
MDRASESGLLPDLPEAARAASSWRQGEWHWAKLMPSIRVHPILVEQLQSVVTTMRYFAAVNGLIGVLMFAWLFNVTSLDRVWLGVWGAAAVGLSVVCVLFAQRLHTLPKRRWAALKRVSALVIGLFGLLAVHWLWLWLHIENRIAPTDYLFFGIIVCGVTAAAAAACVSYLPAYCGFALPILCQVVLSAPESPLIKSLPVSTTLVLFLLVLYLAVWTQELRFVKTVRLVAANKALLKTLTQQRDRIEVAYSQANADRELMNLALKQARQANEDKSRFLAAASHDLRQPIHALGLFLGLIEQSDSQEHRQAILGHASAACKSAGEMLDLLLDYARIDAGVMKPTSGHLDLQCLIRKMDVEFGEVANQHGLVFRTRDTTLVAHADPVFVEVILRNLIANAIRYTPWGGVLVAVRRRSPDLVVEVWDTGVGIAEADRDEIFKEFVQLSNPERDRRKGLGLGLSIAKRMSDLMGAKVTVSSRPGRGSVFRLWLPVSDSDAVIGPPLAEIVGSLQGRSVLFVDDDDAVRVATKHLIESWGATCHVADDIETALDVFRLSQPDVVVSDFRLRGHETGAGLAYELRESSAFMGLDAPPPIILVTGDTAPSRLREAAAVSAVLLHKPLSPERLRAALAAAVSDTSSAPPAATPSPEH